MLHHPGRELVAYQGVGHVHDPGLGQFEDLLLDRHVIGKLLVFAYLCENVIGGEALVLWNIQMLCVLALDI